MSKMNDMSMTIEELRTAAAAIVDAANWLSQQFNGVTPEQSVEKPLLTLEQVRAVLAEKSRAGYTAEIKTILQRHGANKLSDINSAEYAAVLDEAEVLGHAT